MNLPLYKSEEALRSFLRRNYATRSDKKKSMHYVIRWRPCLSDPAKERWSYCVKETDPPGEHSEHTAKRYEEWTLVCDMLGFGPETSVWHNPHNGLKVVS